MNSSLRSSLLIGMLALMVGCSQKGGLGVSFEVDFPAPPKTMSQSAGDIKVDIWAYEKSQSQVLMCSMNELPGVPDGAQANAALDGAARGQYQGMGGTLRTTNKIQLAGKYPGVETEGNGPLGIQARSRIYIVGSRMYQLLVLGDANYISSNEAKKFFDSFRIISE